MADEKNKLPSDELIGKTLGQYTILEEAGRGGMATVYIAKQTSMNRNVAIKVLPPHFLHDPSFLERFQREVEVISHLEHPHILPIYDYGQAQGMPYIAMRYLGGGSMAQMIRRGVPDLVDLVKPMRQISQALDYAHQQGIIHRDLKPGNIMLDENGNAYLSDFGIARVMGSDLTGSAIIGTPAYMSPEQANGISIDGRSDIYSLGVVLFELITGREPYQATTPMALLLKHLNEPMPQARDFREGVPDSVEHVLAKSTAKDADERYTSAGEMAEAFEHALRSRDETNFSTPTKVKAIPDNKATVQAMPDMPTMNQSSTSIEDEVKRQVESALKQSGQIQPKRQSRSPVGIILALLVLIVIVFAGVFLVTQMNNPEPVDPLTALIPTPFVGAEGISDDAYTISIPQVFDDFEDKSDINRTFHSWTARDGSAFVTLVTVADNAMTPDSYASRYYRNNSALTEIDESTAEDGTLRRSYRVTGSETLENGQLDVFYLERGGTLAVVELFTADSSEPDDATIGRLQLILDSLRVKVS